MLNGMLDLSLSGYILATLLLTHITIASVTIFLHRHQAHRALELHPLVSHFFRFWLWMTTGMRTKEWVAIHRKHHAKCETAEDPHSPQVLGIKKVLWQGAELYTAAAKNKGTMEEYGHGTPNDWLERNIYSPYHFVGVGLMLIIDLVLFGLAGISIWAIQMIWIPFWAAGVINGIGHFWGYRNYECKDASRNISPWGILIGGEELHNNHHTYASSAKLSSKWWEFDIGWFYIRTLSLLGLAKIKRVAPRPVINPEKPAMDLDTVKAIALNRFQIMARFSREVINPVNKAELEKANEDERNLLKKARRLLIREQAIMSDKAKQKLADVLENNTTLKTVYQFKQDLQKLWGRQAGSQETVLQQLQEWCRNAEQTGIRALQEFAQQLRTYSLQPARS